MTKKEQSDLMVRLGKLVDKRMGMVEAHATAVELGVDVVDLCGNRALKALVAQGLRYTYRDGMYWIVRKEAK